jgi:hypothetical protein
MIMKNTGVTPRINLAIMILLLLINSSTSVFAQEAPSDPVEETTLILQAKPLQREFSGIQLGMDYDQVDQALINSAYFQYRGPADLSLNPSDEQSVIQTKGFTFLSEGIFQFDENILQLIILVLNTDEISYFDMFQTLSDKYGSPIVLGPDEARWEDETTRISLEYPGTLKYLDLGYFNTRLAESNQLEAVEDFSRDLFLDSF